MSSALWIRIIDRGDEEWIRADQVIALAITRVQEGTGETFQISASVFAHTRTSRVLADGLASREAAHTVAQQIVHAIAANHPGVMSFDRHEVTFAATADELS
ncbi:hypothetical protein [Nocardia sp. CNY236]|uniref:hypothetical protein n=1 Tax=Nocardia sp. CNY236 TaxID=1169152 RepID=UPI00048DF497|nr:hypothetical protein [Nocardia sp. CNY236]